MHRRPIPRLTLVGVVGTGGCVGTTDGPRDDRSPTDRSTPTDSPTPPSDSVDGSLEERVTACEREYIERWLITDPDESITDRSGPIVVATETRSDGAYLELETQVGTVRSTEGEPDEHADYVVRAAYLVTDDETYRTDGFDAEGDPRDGVPVDC